MVAVSQNFVMQETYIEDVQKDLLRQRSDFVGIYLVLHAWLVIVLAMVLFVVLPNPITYLLSVGLIAGRQLGLAILMHDAAHRSLCKSKKLNDFMGRFLCGSPLGASLYGYRNYHLKHHQFTQSKEDPDWELSAPFPIHKKSFWRKVARDLSGITAYQLRLLGWKMSFGKEGSWWQRWHTFWRNERDFIVLNAVIFVVLYIFQNPLLYLTLWIVPLFTVYQLISRIRNIAEHAVVSDNTDPLRNTRTTLTNVFTRCFLAPYWVNYHLEHHLFAYTPCWKLPLAHKFLKQNGWHPKMEISPNYLQVIQKATSRQDDVTEGRGSRNRRKFDI
ncbi:MAG: fatty acid desaturase family protein [Gammaproteobacteria bacterium]|nr:fatty acid desaturase family protein [Gammaproteobacteria bacterium]